MSTVIFELITAENIGEITAFMAVDECSCVSLLGYFVSGTSIVMPTLSNTYRAVYSIEQNEKKIAGVICVTSGGLVLHHLPGFSDSIHAESMITQFAASFKELIKGKSLFCIMGAAASSDFLLSLYAHDVRCNRRYSLMEYTFNQSGMKPADIRKKVPNGFVLRRCTEEDAELLFQLQKEYEIEEVLPPGEQFSAFPCRLGLKQSLKTQYVYALFYDEKPVAKAGTNAQGIHYDQIGGVYTIKEWRNKGFARLLVQYVAESIRLRGKKSVLFVKNENEPAKRAYTNAGFTVISGYAIIYV